MPRELTPYDDELTDPEASYRRGFQHGAAAVLQLVAGKLEPRDARQLSGAKRGSKSNDGRRFAVIE